MIELLGGYLQVSAVALTGTCLRQVGWDIGREASVQILISYHVKGVRQCPRSLPELKNLIYQILHCSNGPVFTRCSRMSSSASKSDSNRFKVWQTVCSCAPGRDSHAAIPDLQFLKQQQSICFCFPCSSGFALLDSSSL